MQQERLLERREELVRVFDYRIPALDLEHMTCLGVRRVCSWVSVYVCIVGSWLLVVYPTLFFTRVIIHTEGAGWVCLDTSHYTKQHTTPQDGLPRRRST